MFSVGNTKNGRQHKVWHYCALLKNKTKNKVQCLTHLGYITSPQIYTQFFVAASAPTLLKIRPNKFSRNSLKKIQKKLLFKLKNTK
jgi:hypothetical protein